MSFSFRSALGVGAFSTIAEDEQEHHPEDVAFLLFCCLLLLLLMMIRFMSYVCVRAFLLACMPRVCILFKLFLSRDDANPRRVN